MFQWRMAIQSAGLLLYRRGLAGVEIFLIHMGGPIWARRGASARKSAASWFSAGRATNNDDGAWSIPKGVIGNDEDPLTAARREFQEETGFSPSGPFVALGTIRQNTVKKLTLWAVEGNLDPQKLVSTLFRLEWPPKSGRFQEFPEADRGAWFARGPGLRKIVKGQRPAIENFFARFGA